MFGLAHVKMAGCAIHPDDTDANMSDEFYIKQAKAYIADTGDADAYFVRNELLAQIKE